MNICKTPAILQIFVFVSFSSALALDEWQYFTYENIYYCLALENNYLWTGSEGGVIRWDVNTGSYEKISHTFNFKNKRIRAVAIDSYGNKWFGTDENGALKFDGDEWTLYSNDNGLSHNRVYSIACDAEGSVWIGTERGINEIDGSGRIVPVDVSGSAELPVYTIFFDKRGTLWFGSRNAVYAYDGNRWKSFTIEGLYGNENEVLAIAEDMIGNIWVGNTSRGPAKYNGFTWRIFETEEIPMVNSIFVDKNNHIWFGTSTGFLSEYDGINWNSFLIGDYYSDNVYSIKGDNSGNLWLATIEGLKKFRDSEYQIYKTDEGLIGFGANDILIDRDNNKWFGSDQGLTKFDGTSWSYYSFEHGNPVNRVDALGMDRDGKIWVSADYSVFTYDENTWENVSGNAEAWANDFDFDRYGNVWCGASGGVYKYNGSTWMYYEFISTRSNNDVNSVVVDFENRVWFCALDGLRMLDGQKWIKYSMNDGLPDTAFTAAAIDHDGNKWFGTENSGIIKYDGENWIQYDTDNGLMNNYVEDIAIDREGRVWAATGGWMDWGNQHVSRFDGSNWIDYSELRGKSVYCIRIDSLGNKWFGTGSGVYMLATEDITSIEVENPKPQEFYLGPNYPNPFNHETIIRYSLPKHSQLKIEIYNMLGQKIRTLINDAQPAGRYTTIWDGLNDNRRIVASGIYIYRLETPNYRQSRKMTLLK